METAAEAGARADAAARELADRSRVDEVLADRKALPLAAGALGLGQADLVTLFEQVEPGVVSLNVESEVQSPFGEQGFRQSGTGSGWLFDESHIVTNNHVVEGAETVEVVFYDGERREGRVIGTDRFSDLAVLEVADMPSTARDLPTEDRFDDLKVGQPVIAIGNPFGLENTMTYGIISALGRTIRANPSTGGPVFSIPKVIQTDAPVNPGNSGGPLLNLQGEVIGVNAQISTNNVSPMGGAANSGVAFAIPSTIVQKVVPALISGGSYDWSYLGVSGSSIDLGMQKANNLSSTRGAYIQQVVDGGPSAGVLTGASNLAAVEDEAQSDEEGQEGQGIPGLPPGMQIVPIPQPGERQRSQVTPVGGDVVVAIDGQTVGSFEDMLTYVALETVPGQTVELTILRGGQEIKVPVTLGKRPTN
jgi:2-alkenal reductase